MGNSTFDDYMGKWQEHYGDMSFSEVWEMENGKRMNNRNLIQEHKAVCNTLNAIYEQKNRAYGNSFGDTYRDLGIISAVTRISDKFNRLKTLCRQPDIPQGDESIADTLLDMANYCIMTYMEFENDKNKGIVIGEGIDAEKLEIMRRAFSKAKPIVDIGGNINAIQTKQSEDCK